MRLIGETQLGITFPFVVHEVQKQLPSCLFPCRLLIMDYLGPLILWNFVPQKEPLVFPLETWNLSSSVFNLADVSFVITMGKRLQVWDLASGIVREFEAAALEDVSTRWTPDHKRCVLVVKTADQYFALGDARAMFHEVQPSTVLLSFQHSSVKFVETSEECWLVFEHHLSSRLQLQMDCDFFFFRMGVVVVDREKISICGDTHKWHTFLIHSRRIIHSALVGSVWLKFIDSDNILHMCNLEKNAWMRTGALECFLEDDHFVLLFADGSRRHYDQDMMFVRTIMHATQVGKFSLFFKSWYGDIFTSITRDGTWHTYEGSKELKGPMKSWNCVFQLADHRLVSVDHNSSPPLLTTWL